MLAYFSYPDNAEPRSSLVFLAGSCFVLNLRLHLDQPISLKSSQVLPLFFSLIFLSQGEKYNSRVKSIIMFCTGSLETLQERELS